MISVLGYLRGGSAVSLTAIRAIVSLEIGGCFTHALLVLVLIWVIPELAKLETTLFE
jgi:hypothetical protein